MRLLLPLILISSAVAHAEGLYVEGGTLARTYDLSMPGASGGVAKGKSLSGAMRLGYEVDDRWAVEAGYFSHGSPSYAYRLGAQEGRLTIHGHSWQLGGRATWPINERFALVGRLGLARNSSSVSGTGEATSRTTSGSTTALYGGLGLETTLTPAWQLGLAWEHLGMSRGKGGAVINGISTTLRFRF